jgi:hypothetical protein
MSTERLLISETRKSPSQKYGRKNRVIFRVFEGSFERRREKKQNVKERAEHNNSRSREIIGKMRPFRDRGTLEKMFDHNNSRRGRKS